MMRSAEDMEVIAESYFEREMVAASRTKTWDPNIDGVVTTMDPYLTAINRQDMFDLSGADEGILVEPPLTARDEHVLDLAQGRGTDSVGTFDNRSAADMSSLHDPSWAMDADDISRDGTVTSLQTTQTELTNQITNMEERMQERMREEIEANNKQLNSQLAAIQEALSLLTTRPPPLPPPIDPTPTGTEVAPLSHPNPSPITPGQPARNDSAPAEPSTPPGGTAGTVT